MKSWFKSKTILVNIAILVAAIFATLQGNEWVMSNPQIATGLVAAASALNMVLRFVTSKGIE